MSRKIAELREVIQKLIPLLTDKGLKVTQRGSRAYVQTDPATKRPVRVNIPNISENAEDSFIRAVSGFIDHEVAHVLITDWNYYAGGASATDLRRKDVQKLMNVHNIIEDTMIEREIVKIFPGSRKNIADLRQHFIAKITKPAMASASTERERFNYLLVPAMRALAGHTEFQEYMDENGYWEEPMIKTLVEAFDAKTLDDLKTAETTKETLVIAKEMYDILYAKKPEPPKPSEPPKEKSESEDKPDKKADEGDGDGERDHDESEDGEENDGDKSEGSGEEAEETEDEKGEEPDKSDVDDGPEEEADGDAEGDDDASSEPDKSEDDTDTGSDDTGDDEDGEDDTSSADDGEDGGDPASADDGADDDIGASGDDPDDSEPDDTAEDDGVEEAGSSDGEEDEEGDDKSDGGSSDGPNEHCEDKSETPDGPSQTDEDEEAPDGDGSGAGTKDSKSIFEMEDDALEGRDISEEMSNYISDIAVDIIKQSDWSVFSREWDIIEPIEVPENMNKNWVPEMEEQARAMTGRMQKDIERIMASQSHVVNTPGHRRGRLHSPSLYRVGQGDDRVFTQRQEHKSKDTSVMLLVDNSGSMVSHNKIGAAMQATYALSSTLDRVNISHEVLGFTTGGWNSSETLYEAVREEYDRSGIEYDRVTPLAIPIYKTFDERLDATVKRRMAYMKNAKVNLAGNIDGESLMIAAERLAVRPEKRKVMIVLSDGQPAAGAKGGPHLKATVKHLNDNGIETIGIGIMSNAVKAYYEKYVVLHSVSDLPGQVMTEIKSILI